MPSSSAARRRYCARFGARRSGSRSRNSTAEGPVSRIATLASSAACRVAKVKAAPTRRAGRGSSSTSSSVNSASVPSDPASSRPRLGSGVEELAQVVAGGAAARPRVVAGDGLAVLLAHLRERRREPLPRRPADAGREVAAGAAAERGRLAAGEHAGDAQHLVLALAVDDRPRARRVVADHAGDRGLVDGGRVGAELEAVRRRGRVERRLDHAGLDPGPAAVRVDLQDAVELEAVDDDAGADRLPGHAGGGAARHDRQAGRRRRPPPRRPGRPAHRRRGRPPAPRGSRRRRSSRASAGAAWSTPRRRRRAAAPRPRRAPPARARGCGDGRPCRLGYRPAARRRRARPRTRAQSPPGLTTGIQRESCCRTPNIMSTPNTTSSAPAATWMPR